MSTNKFKVGYKVVVVDHKHNSEYFSVGARGVVVAAGGDYYLVRFTSGTFDTDCDGTWWVSGAGLKELPMRRMEAHKTAYRTEQERAISGGIQSHSVGDIYSLAVVGYDKSALAARCVLYTLENLQTGEVCTSGNLVRQWDNATDALAFAKALNTLLGVNWRQGRPVFDQFGVLRLKEERSIKDFEVTLLAAIAEYQRALEQDIG